MTEDPSRKGVSMEVVIRELQAMQAEMVDALGRRLGKRHWKIVSESHNIRRSMCGDEGDGEIAFLPETGFLGTYPAHRWHESASVVRRIAARHGFTDASVVIDRPDFFEIDARDAHGAQVVFGMSHNTSILIHSGCHVRDDPPGGS